MSRLEMKAKPLIAEAMRGNPISFDDAARLNLCKWALKTAVMYEYAKGHNKYFTSVERTNLFKHGLVPKYTLLSAARFAEPGKTGVAATGMQVAIRKDRR